MTEEVRVYEDVARVAGEGFGVTGLGGGTLAALRMAGGSRRRDAAVAVRAALDEDFAYGPDVTSGATVAGRTVTADVVARGRGAGGPGRARPRCSTRILGGVRVRGDREPTVGGDPPAGGGRGAHRGGVRGAAGERACKGGAGGGADDAQFPDRPVGDRDRHPGLAGTRFEAPGAVVRDTRKTTPGLRVLDKYAVRCGGGRNHRMGLGDAALVKDNHVAAAGGVAAAVTAVRSAAAARSGSAGSAAGAGAGLVVEVECDSVAQVREALDAGAHFLLLDNMPLGSLREAVAVARDYYGVRLEASGGLRLENAREVAQTGVDYLAVGALTHSSPALDLGLDYADEG